MFRKTIAAGHAVLAVLLSSAMLGQAPSAPTSSFANPEFPVIMRQNVVAGATAVGSKVEAKLAVATLVNGAVVPQGAILSGEVIESVAKSISGPSRLAIRMDSAQWKDGGAPKVLPFTKRVYLTAWYYPLAPPTRGQFSDEPSDAAATAGPRSGHLPIPLRVIRFRTHPPPSHSRAATLAEATTRSPRRRRRAFRSIAS